MTAVAAHQDGLLDLRLRVVARGRTVVASRAQRFPLRMTVPHYLDEADRDMAFIYVQNPAGAVCAGDVLSMRIAAEPGARVHLTTQSATKVHRMEHGHALQELDVRVGAGALVEYIPDLLIPQAGADYRQRTAVDVCEGGVFIGSELVSPGRRAIGERFAYERLRLRTEVCSGGRSLCVETLEFEPGLRRPDAPALLGGHDYVGSLLVAAPGRDLASLSERADAELAGRPEGLAATCLLPHGAGLLARVLAGTADGARRLLDRAWALVREALFGLALPRVRK